jgi:hypothetical protein
MLWVDLGLTTFGLDPALFSSLFDLMTDFLSFLFVQTEMLISLLSLHDLC